MPVVPATLGSLELGTTLGNTARPSQHKTQPTHSHYTVLLSHEIGYRRVSVNCVLFAPTIYLFSVENPLKQKKTKHSKFFPCWCRSSSLCSLWRNSLFLSRHVFHKSCVDPWLSEHCTCPMCKLNILKALGIVVCSLIVTNFVQYHIHV
jgi:hypothetical protein